MEQPVSAEMSVRALLFDLDGTLIDSHAVVRRTWKRWADSVGIPLESFFHLTPGRPGREVMAEILPNRSESDHLADSEALLEDELADTGGVTALPGAARILAALPDRAWAIVTACTEPLARARLAAAELPAPDVLVTSELTDAGKPDPAGYLLAAQRLGLDPRSCVVVEDASAGVRAGIAAGMPVIGVGGPIVPVPTWELAGLENLRVTVDGAVLRLTRAVAQHTVEPIDR